MRRLSAMLLMLLASSAATAVDLTLLLGYQNNGDFEVGASVNVPPPALSGLVAGDALGLDSGAVFGAALDFPLPGRPDTRMGVFVSHQQAEFADDAGFVDPEVAVTHIHATSMIYYPNGRWEGFAMAGLGVTLFQPGDKSLRDVSKFSAQIAAGGNYRLAEQLLLRMELRWIPTFFGGGGQVFCSGGCNIELESNPYNQIQANLGLQFRF